MFSWVHIGGAQGVASSDYTVDEAIKDLYEIQYKVKGANDSTYTTTAPTNAGTYEVRIYCRGNATYLKGEVAKTDYVINKYKVEIARGSSFKVAYDKAAMEDPNVQYIVCKLHLELYLTSMSSLKILSRSVSMPFSSSGSYFQPCE